MAGDKFTSEELNEELVCIINMLKTFEIKNWFIGYGTLLGIIREQSCIDKDDDVDIIIHKNEYATLFRALEKSGYTTTLFFPKKRVFKKNETPDFLKVTRHKEKDKPTVDFYLTSTVKEGVYDKWENVIWTDVYPIEEREWNEKIINIPNNYEIKLERRYGKDWMTPQDTKGPKPKAKKL